MLIWVLAGSLAILCHGCAGGGEGTAGGPASSLQPAAARTVNAACLRGYRRMLARARGAGDAAKAALPVLESTIVHIARTAPAGVGARLSPFVLEFEDAVHTNEGVSATLAQLEAKFKRADRMARRLGFGACAVGG